MHTVFALLCFVVVIHWLIFPYPSGLLHWHCGNLTIAPVPAKQPWWIWTHTSCEFIINDCITTTKQSTTQSCAYFLGYTVHRSSSLGVFVTRLDLISPSNDSGKAVSPKLNDDTIQRDRKSHTIIKSVKCILCGVWVSNSANNFKDALQNFIQICRPTQCKICILLCVKIVTNYGISKSFKILSLGKMNPRPRAPSSGRFVEIFPINNHPYRIISALSISRTLGQG